MKHKQRESAEKRHCLRDFPDRGTGAGRQEDAGRRTVLRGYTDQVSAIQAALTHLTKSFCPAYPLVCGGGDPERKHRCGGRALRVHQKADEIISKKNTFKKKGA